MNRKTASSVRQRGFTMAEMLVVMAIIAVLSGIAVPNAMRVLNNVRQMSLNRAAETIYMTAQRNLIAYKVRGNSTVPGSPDTSPSGTIYTVTSGDDKTNPDAAANIILSAKTISPTLHAGSWVIKYDSTFLVRKVFYSEEIALANFRDYMTTDSGAANVNYDTDEVDYTKGIGKIGSYG